MHTCVFQPEGVRDTGTWYPGRSRSLDFDDPSETIDDCWPKIHGGSAHIALPKVAIKTAQKLKLWKSDMSLPCGEIFTN